MCVVSSLLMYSNLFNMILLVSDHKSIYFESLAPLKQWSLYEEAFKKKNERSNQQ